MTSERGMVVKEVESEVEAVVVFMLKEKIDFRCCVKVRSCRVVEWKRFGGGALISFQEERVNPS